MTERTNNTCVKCLFSKIQIRLRRMDTGKTKYLNSYTDKNTMIYWRCTQFVSWLLVLVMSFTHFTLVVLYWGRYSVFLLLSLSSPWNALHSIDEWATSYHMKCIHLPVLLYSLLFLTWPRCRTQSLQFHLWHFGRCSQSEWLTEVRWSLYQ